MSGKRRGRNADVFVAVPPGTQTLKVIARLKGLQWRTGVDRPGLATNPRRIAGAIPHTENTFEPVKDGEIRRAVDDPKPGVWHSRCHGGDAANYDDKARRRCNRVISRSPQLP